MTRKDDLARYQAEFRQRMAELGLKQVTLYVPERFVPLFREMDAIFKKATFEKVEERGDGE